MSLDELRTGATASLSQNVSMPYAIVNISISSEKVNDTIGIAPTFNHFITMDSEFSMVSDYDQNCSIAFAYPETWGHENRDVVYPFFEIELDGQPLTYTLVNGSNLEINTETKEDYEELEFLYYVRLAIVNVTLKRNQTHVLGVFTSMEVSLTENIFRFSYCVGSAKVWKGSTQEIVRMTIENTDELMGTHFFPNDSLTVIRDGQKSIGEWQLEFPSFEKDFVYCDLLQSQWPYGEEFENLEGSVASVLLGGAIIVLIFSLVLTIIIIKKSS
jgi:hypothetical protein